MNCYILKPIKNSIEYSWIEYLPKLDTNIYEFLSQADFNRNFKMDTLMKHITSFEFQKKILINDACFKKLNNPDSIDLVNIYFSSRFNTSNLISSNVRFIRVFEKNILNFGNSMIYEYQLSSVSNVEPHFFHIILLKKEINELGEDYEGIVIFSDGVEWKEIKEKNVFIPIHFTNLRGGLQIKSPLFFDKNQFIPIAHFKS